jgi:hypothetical protein
VHQNDLAAVISKIHCFTVNRLQPDLRRTVPYPDDLVLRIPGAGEQIRSHAKNSQGKNHANHRLIVPAANSLFVQEDLPVQRNIPDEIVVNYTLPASQHQAKTGLQPPLKGVWPIPKKKRRHGRVTPK